MSTVNILAFTGSMRAQSINRRLLGIAIDKLRDLGASVTEVELRELQLPMFDEDMEAELKAKGEPMPAPVVKLQDLMIAHNGLLLGLPEYNGSITPAMKNAIDWCSRRADDTGPLACFRGKTAGLTAASGGKLGGIRGLPETRRILSGIGVTVVPQDFAMGGASRDLDADVWTEDGTINGAHRVANALHTTTKALNAH